MDEKKVSNWIYLSPYSSLGYQVWKDGFRRVDSESKKKWNLSHEEEWLKSGEWDESQSWEKGKWLSPKGIKVLNSKKKWRGRFRMRNLLLEKSEGSLGLIEPLVLVRNSELGIWRRLYYIWSTKWRLPHLIHNLSPKIGYEDSFHSRSSTLCFLRPRARTLSKPSHVIYIIIINWKK